MMRKSMHCRTCFCVLESNISQRTSPVHNIFDSKNFLKKLKLCSSTHIQPYDQYPNFICQSCYEKVLEFYEFQLMCRESLKMYNDLYNNHNDLQEALDNVNYLNSSTNIILENCTTPQLNDGKGNLHNDKDNKADSEYQIVCPPFVEDKNRKQEVFAPIYTNSDVIVDDTIHNVFIQQDTISHEEDVYTTNETFEDNLYSLLMQNDSINQQDVAKSVTDQSEQTDNVDINKDVETSPEVESTVTPPPPPPSEISVNQPTEDCILPYPMKNLKFYCNICDKLFRFRHNLEAHKRKDHEGLPAYECKHEDCKKTFDSFHIMRDHLREHDGVMPTVFRCEDKNCDREFPRRASLVLHMSKAHKRLPAVQMHKCEVCGKTFKQLHKLQEHSFVHKDKSTWMYTCDYEGCKKKCRTWSQMKTHKQRHACVKNYKCPHCGVAKTTAQELKVHINFHTSERTWQCEHCPKVCKTLANFNRHIKNQHSGSKKDFKCSFCKAAFGTIEVMKSHEKRHTSNRPHVCDECGIRFIWAYKLKKHLKTHLSRKT